MLFNVIENISICCVFLGISFPLGYREGPDRSLSQTERHSFPAVTNTYKLDAHNDNDNDNDNPEAPTYFMNFVSVSARNYRKIG